MSCPNGAEGEGLDRDVFADACDSDREIDAIPGTYDDVKGKKYPAVNR